MDARRKLELVRDLFDREVIDQDTALRLLDEPEPVRLESVPYELDVCEVCGEVFADAERLAHGHFLFRGRADGPFMPRLVELVEEDRSGGRKPWRFEVGYELYNALDRELGWSSRSSEWERRRLSDGLVDLQPWRPYDYPESLYIRGASIAATRELPLWGARLLRRGLEDSIFFGVDRSDPTRLAGQRLDVAAMARLVREASGQDRIRELAYRESPFFRMLAKPQNFSGPTVTLVSPEDARNFDANMNVDVGFETRIGAYWNMPMRTPPLIVTDIDRDAGRLTLEHVERVRRVSSGTFEVTLPRRESELVALWGRELDAAHEATKRRIERAHQLLYPRGYDAPPSPRVVAPSSGPNRAERRRRGRPPKNEENSTPRALRTPRKPWER